MAACNCGHGKPGTEISGLECAERVGQGDERWTATVTVNSSGASPVPRRQRSSSWTTPVRSNLLLLLQCACHASSSPTSDFQRAIQLLVRGRSGRSWLCSDCAALHAKVLLSLLPASSRPVPATCYRGFGWEPPHCFPWGPSLAGEGKLCVVDACHLTAQTERTYLFLSEKDETLGATRTSVIVHLELRRE